jgi:DNA-binding response OmpR family regulator
VCEWQERFVMTKKKVLVVDDDKDCVQLVKDFLESRGFEIVTAVEGETGLAKAKALKPDLIILDVMMPLMDGITVLQKLKENPATQSIPVIMLTAKDRDEDVLKGYKHGAEYYITKPFELNQLILGVNLMIGKENK